MIFSLFVLYKSTQYFSLVLMNKSLGHRTIKTSTSAITYEHDISIKFHTFTYP